MILDGGAVELDHELQDGEVYTLENTPMRVAEAWSEDREDGRVRVVVLEGPVEA